MKYEFHVGDYVETKTGTIGYVSEVPEQGNSFWTATKLSERDIGDNRYTINIPYCIFSFERFNRIGQYDFTKKDKGKIEPMSNDPIDWEDSEVLSKINELVEAVNELRDKND